MESLDFKKSAEVLKSILTLRQVMENYGIILTGKRLIKCPFHEDSTASMQVSEVDSGEGFFYCHACTDKHGDLISFVAFEEGCSPGDAILLLAKRYSIDVKTRANSASLASTLTQILEGSPGAKAKSKIYEQLEASKSAQSIIESVKYSQHLTPYMVKKQIQHFGTFNRGTTLIVPVTDLAGSIWGVQYIYSEGGKSFLTNCRIEGNFLRIGPEPTDLAFLAEGYATGASVYMASDITTYVCFKSKNIFNVYEELKGVMPNIDFIVAGDNDSAGRGHGLKAVYPPADMDWNDLWCERGKEAVASMLSRDKVQISAENPLVSKLENILRKGI